MRSIIDEIAAAEQQADEIRVNATAEARERIGKANDAAAAALNELDKTEREKTREALLAAERDGEAQADKMRQNMEAETDALCKSAAGRVGDAKEYLLKKVRAEA